MDGGPSAEQIAAGVGGIVTLGGGVRWLMNWNDRRIARREAALAAGEAALSAGEKLYRERVEGDLADLKREMAEVKASHEQCRRDFVALVLVMQPVIVELRVHSPHSPALKIAERHLRRLFPVDSEVPSEMTDILARLDRP